MPQRRDIDPLDMPRSLLPHLALVEPVEGGPVVRFRLIGTELVQRYGRDATGKTSADIWQGPYRGHMEQLYAMVFADRRPLYAEGTQAWPEEGMSRVRRLLLPIAADGSGHVAFVLGAVTWTVSGEPPSQPAPKRIAVEALEKAVLQATFRGLLDPA